MSHSFPTEPALEPDLPIIDPRHHLWDRTMRPPPATPPQRGLQKALLLAQRHLLDELRVALSSGHRVIAIVHVEAWHAYRTVGPESLRSIGETEFLVASAEAYAAEGGDTRVCAGIVGAADLTLGDAVAPVLEGHLEAGGGRFRGVRQMRPTTPTSKCLGPPTPRPRTSTGATRSAPASRG